MGVKVSKPVLQCHLWLFLTTTKKWNPFRTNGKKNVLAIYLFIKPIMLWVLFCKLPGLPPSAASQRSLSARSSRLSSGCRQWEAPGEAAWNSRVLVGKWHLPLNAAGLPCQCALVKYVPCHPVCRRFVIQIKAEKLHISRLYHRVVWAQRFRL